MKNSLVKMDNQPNRQNNCIININVPLNYIDIYEQRLDYVNIPPPEVYNVQNNDNNQEEYRQLAEDIRNNNIKKLDLVSVGHDVGFGDELVGEDWYSRILRLMIDNKSVEEIYIFCSVDDLGVANLTRDFFMYNTGVKKVNLILSANRCLEIYLEGLLTNKTIDNMTIIFENNRMLGLARNVSNLIINNHCISELKIISSIDDPSASILSNALAQNNSIRKLSLSGGRIAPDFFKFLSVNSTLKSLNLKIWGSVNDCKDIIRCLSIPNNLTELNITRGTVDMSLLYDVLRINNITTLSLMIHSAIEIKELVNMLREFNKVSCLSIKFTGNFPIKEEIGSLSDLLFDGSALRKLKLDGFNTFDFDNFAVALETNSSLKELVMGCDIVSEKAISSLNNSMKTNKGLKFILINGSTEREPVILHSNYYTQLVKVHQSLEVAGAKIVTDNDEVRERLNNLFMSFLARNNGDDRKMGEIIPVELQYMIVREYFGELLKSFD